MKSKMAPPLKSLLALCAGLLICASPAAAAQSAAAPAEKSFTLAAEQIGHTKFWIPSTITVVQGDKVKLTLKNDIEGNPNQHGFSIPAHNITELVTRGTPKTVEFVADKPGVFQYICQVHPPHLGGQLIVLPKPAASNFAGRSQ